MAELDDRVHTLFGASESEGGMSDNDSDESSDVEYLAFKKCGALDAQGVS